jgi:FlaG/FlaF family flagellin (archaellin)
MKGRIQHDEAVSSVIGEMIMIVLVIILVALFATSAFSLIPGGREPSVDVVMKNGSGGTPSAGDTTVIFWHKGGDWVEKKDLAVVVVGKDGGREPSDTLCLYGHAGTETVAFDLGGRLKADLRSPLRAGDTVRLVTQKNVVYSGEIS